MGAVCMLRYRLIDNTVKLGGGSVMIWTCMARQGVGYATNIDGTINGYLFLQSLMGELLNTQQYCGLNHSPISFEEDNDPKHTCRKVKEWLGEQDFETMVWPAQSPNLNLIEHLWSDLKRRLAEQEPTSNGIHELWKEFRWSGRGYQCRSVRS
jgi:hypothetical protein